MSGRSTRRANFSSAELIGVAGCNPWASRLPLAAPVHIPVATLWAHYRSGDVDARLAELAAPAGTMIDDLLWWTAALKAARTSASSSRLSHP